MGCSRAAGSGVLGVSFGFPTDEGSGGGGGGGGAGIDIVVAQDPLELLVTGFSRYPASIRIALPSSALFQ